MQIYNKCSGRIGQLLEDSTFLCFRCFDTALLIDGRLCDHVMIDQYKLELAESFCYLGDNQCPGGTCEACTIHRCRVTW